MMKCEKKWADVSFFAAQATEKCHFIVGTIIVSQTDITSLNLNQDH